MNPLIPPDCLVVLQVLPAGYPIWIDCSLFGNWQNVWVFLSAPRTTGSAKAASHVCGSVPAVFDFARVTSKRCWNNLAKQRRPTARCVNKHEAVPCLVAICTVMAVTLWGRRGFIRLAVCSEKLLISTVKSRENGAFPLCLWSEKGCLLLYLVDIQYETYNTYWLI
jgi:hypothetical protein